MDSLTIHIKTLRQQNVPDEKIREQLQKTGWTDADISRAFTTASDTNDQLPQAPLPPLHKSTVLSNDFDIWVTFAHVLLFISLYALALSLASLLYQFIDIWLSDSSMAITSLIYQSTMQSTVMKISLAGLIVSWPAFSLLFLYVYRKTAENPAIRNIRSRKTLIYLTMIVAFVIVLGNLISTVFGFLNGTVTVNFLAHLSVTLGISGLIFGYLFSEIRQDRNLTA